ncbi:MAG: CRTAC1 family protein [Thermoanaerobaculia bacterium]|nr:CRTAC1 family protein [Thermoanaerobaculia bacterium]
MRGVIVPNRVLALGMILWLVGGCDRQNPSEPDAVLIDAAVASGLSFTHHNGMSGEYYFSEMAGPGAALLDFDNDGDLDVYLVQGRALVPTAPVDEQPFRDRLFRNDLEPASTPGASMARFSDVTEISGLDSRGYGMGVTVGDVDNDGWVDIYVTNFGANMMWRNQGGQEVSGDVVFSDVTEVTGTGDARWSSSAAFLDFDRDGWLDLYVVNYTDFRIANHKPCPNPQGAPEYCGPLAYRPQADRLFRNLGDSDDGIRFEDVSFAGGMVEAPAPGLGVVTVDVDRDGWIDIYVANDQAHNQLWMNQGDGTFRDEALLRGCAVDAQGRAQASMGIDAADVDGDGDVDLFLTHLLSETNTLYVNDGNGLFSDQTVAAGLGVPSLAFTGFGTAFFDLDNDGWLDLLTVNGEVRTLREQRAAGEALPLRQPNLLFRNRGAALGFDDWSDRAPVLAQALVSRGAAFGDVDNDGDTDVLVQNNNGPAQLLVNQVGSRDIWLGVRLIGDSGRDMLGASVSLSTPDGSIFVRRVRTDGSYLSANDPRLLFGLGRSGSQGTYVADVQWPNGRQERFSDLRSGRYQDLVEGQGLPLDSRP